MQSLCLPLVADVTKHWSGDCWPARPCTTSMCTNLSKLLHTFTYFRFTDLHFSTSLELDIVSHICYIRYIPVHHGRTVVFARKSFLISQMVIHRMLQSPNQ